MLSVKARHPEQPELVYIIHALGNGVIKGNGKDAGGGEFGVEFVDGGYLIRFSSDAELARDDHRLEECDHCRQAQGYQRDLDFAEEKFRMLNRKKRSDTVDFGNGLHNYRAIVFPLDVVTFPCRPD
jgi:hypothetical protein